MGLRSTDNMQKAMPGSQDIGENVTNHMSPDIVYIRKAFLDMNSQLSFTDQDMNNVRIVYVVCDMQGRRLLVTDSVAAAKSFVHHKGYKLFSCH